MDEISIEGGSKRPKKEGRKGTKLLSIVEKLRDVKDDTHDTLLETPSEVDETEIIDSEPWLRDHVSDIEAVTSDVILTSSGGEMERSFSNSKSKNINPESFVKISSETVPENNDCELIRALNGNSDKNISVTILPSDESDNDIDNAVIPTKTVPENIDCKLITELNDNSEENATVAICLSDGIDNNISSDVVASETVPENIDCKLITELNDDSEENATVAICLSDGIDNNISSDAVASETVPENIDCKLITELNDNSEENATVAICLSDGIDNNISSDIVASETVPENIDCKLITELNDNSEENATVAICLSDGIDNNISSNVVASETVPEKIDYKFIREINGNPEEKVTVTILPSDESDNDIGNTVIASDTVPENIDCKLITELNDNSEENTTVAICPSDEIDNNISSNVVASETVPEKIDFKFIREINGNPEEKVTVTILPSDESDDGNTLDVTPFLCDTSQDKEDDSQSSEGSIPSDVMCTACGIDIKTLEGKLCRHPVLGVLVCKACNKFYNSSSFKRDESGMEEHCKWCGDGGDVIMCDFCEKVFCRKCVKHNMGKPFLKILLESSEMKWKCFACDTTQLEVFVEQCNSIMKILQTIKLKDFAFENKKTHLGGPSQMQRKKRLNCISHSLEDGVALPNDILLLPDELTGDFPVKALGKEKHKKSSPSQTKAKTTDGKAIGVEEGRQFDKTHIHGSVHEKDKISIEKLTSLKGQFCLKDFNLIIERVKVPENCVTGTKTNASSTKSTGGSDEPSHVDDCVISLDSESEASAVELNVTEDIPIPDILEDSVEPNNEIDSNCSDLKQEGSSDQSSFEAIVDEYEVLASSGSDIDSSDSEATGSALESDSDDNVAVVRKRSIRDAGKGKEEGASNLAPEQGSNGAKIETSSENEDKQRSEDEQDSDAMQHSHRSPKKPQKGSKSSRKRAVKSDSDSDHASRTKKRRRRRRCVSKGSLRSDQSDEDSLDNASKEEDEPGKGKKGKKNGKRKSKRKAGDKRKRRGRVVRSDSDSSTDDDLSPNKNKGRKKIRRLLGDEELTEETRKARKLEEERRQRLLERTHAKYDEEHVVAEEEPGQRIVLERYKESGEPLVQVHESFVDHLKPHQIEGVQFLYDCLFESVEKYKKGDKGNGALLAHCMGLGKTLQIITLIHTVMNDPSIGLSRVLVVAPVNTVYNWEMEFEKWLEVDERIDVHILADAGHNKRNRMAMLKTWFKNGGILILGYEMYRNLTQFKRINNKKQKKIITETLVDPGPDMVVCDEGHILRNDLSAISQALTKIKTLRRVVLTGTPLQNNLSEYFVMVSFVKPNLLGTKKEFTNRFMNPILNGQCSNSTPADVKFMKQRCHVLHETLAASVQRKDYSVLTPFLTPKHEYTIFVRLGDKQRKMYQHYLESFVCGNLSEIRARGSSLFSDYQCLMKIWTHPWAIKLEAIRRLERKSNYDDIEEFLDDENSEQEDEVEEEEGGEPKDKWNSGSDSSDFGRRRSGRNRVVSDSDSGSFKHDSSDNGDSDEANTPKSSLEESEPPAAREKYFSRSSQKDKTHNKPSTSRTNSLRASRSSMVMDKDVFNAEDSNDDAASDAADSASDIIVVKPFEEPVRGMGNTRSGTKFKERPEDKELVEEEQEWYDQFLDDGDDSNIELSGKLVLLLEVLANAEVVGDKVLVFSQSLVSLDLIERVLGGGKIGGNDVNWFKGVDYFRLDGSTPAKTRQRYSEIFNDPDNTTARLFLISTRAGSLGINLVAANRVIVFDCSWNPSHDVQSVFRVYRFGQVKPVYVYRFVTQGTMEEKIYDRQITKLAMSGRVVDEQQIERHFTEEEIRELYTLNADEYKESEEVSTPQLPADPILAEVLQRQHPKWITKYHEHDLLLENIEGEKLSEEERKQAWDSYQAEKDSATRNIVMAEERMQILREMHQKQLEHHQQQQQQKQQQYAQTLQQQHMQRIQQQQQQQQIQQQLRQQQQLQQIRIQQHQERNIDTQIQHHQDAIRQMAQRMRAPNNLLNYNQIPRISSLQPATRLGNVEERYRNLQINNLANMRNPVPVALPWNTASTGQPDRNAITLPGAVNVPRQPVPSLSALRATNIPPASRNPRMDVSARLPHPIVKPEVVDLS